MMWLKYPSRSRVTEIYPCIIDGTRCTSKVRAPTIDGTEDGTCAELEEMNISRM
jgi:hypothetical protein